MSQEGDEDAIKIEFYNEPSGSLKMPAIISQRTGGVNKLRAHRVESRKKPQRKLYESPDSLLRERAICMARDCKVRKVYAVLQECEKRIASKSYTAETCHQETVDWVHALDHCIHDKAFSKLS